MHGVRGPARGTQPWAFGIDEARPILRAALGAGITTFDTANYYSYGASEEITGALIKELANRDEVLIQTKVFARMQPGPKGGGLSRAALFTQVDASLERLGTDYIDLYQIHRYDPDTPIEETLQALDDLVRSGKVRYIGASSMWTWHFAQAQYTADLHGWTRFVSMQDHYNLVMREEEREMHPFCLDQGVGVLAWAPLGRGMLSRAWDENTSYRSTHQSSFDAGLYKQDEAADHRIVDAVGSIAAERGISRTQVALAWLLHRPAVTAPIVGVSKPDHVADAVAATDVTLTDDELARLAEPYTPRQPEGL